MTTPIRKVFYSIFLIALFTGTGHAQHEAQLSITVQIPSFDAAPQYLPVLTDILLSDLEGIDPQNLPEGAVAAVENGRDGAVHPVPAQFNRIAEDRGRICLLLPTTPAGARTVSVRLVPADVPGTAINAQQVVVAQQDETLVISNRFFNVTHDPQVGGGLISEIGFPRSGKVFSGFRLYDRLYNKDDGQFFLWQDDNPDVQLIAAGPLYAEVQVRARYLDGGKNAPPSAPRATYCFRYFAGTPLVGLETVIEQDTPYPWEQLHIMELLFQDDSFTEFALGPVGERVAFTDEMKAHNGQGWGALLDGTNAIGMFSSRLIVYDGRGGHGRYLHGPWVPWASEQVTFSTPLWIAEADDPVAEIARRSEITFASLAGLAMTPQIVSELDGLIALREQLSAEAPRTFVSWAHAQVRSALQQGMSMQRAQEVIAQIRTAVADEGPLPEGLELLPGSELRFLSVGRLGIGIAVDERGARLHSVFDGATGREMVASASDLFTLALVDDAGNRSRIASGAGWRQVDVRSGEPGASGAPLEITWRSPEDPDLAGLAVTVSGSVRDTLSGWRVAVENDSPRWSIDRVLVGAVNAGVLGDDAGDDILLLPNGYGKAYPRPIHAGVRYNGFYPSGSCNMQWMAVTDPHGGLYVAMHDPTAATKDLKVDLGDEKSGLPLYFDIPAPNASVVGNEYANDGEIIFGVTDGGWYPVTQAYRAWLEREAPWWPEPGTVGRRDYPQWVRETQAWVLTGGAIANVVESVQQFAEYMQVPTAVHWYNWHQIRFDDDYPHYFPTREGFREGVAAAQQAGVRVMPYINGRLWDSDLEDFQQEAHLYATKDKDGNPHIEVYGSGEELAVMCPSQEFWHDTLDNIVMRLVAEEGVDGVYLDQVAAARPQLCYVTQHGHPLAGGHWWVDGYWQMLERMRANIAEVHPDKMLTTESNAEPYAKYFDGYLMCNSLGDQEIHLFPAVYGDKIMMFGRYMQDTDWHDPSMLAQRQGQLFVTGTQLWWSRTGIINTPGGPWLRDLAHLRQQVNDFFFEGKMAPPPVITEPVREIRNEWTWRGNPYPVRSPELWSSAWQKPDGELALLFVNVHDESRRWTVRFDPTAYGLPADAGLTVQRLGPQGPVGAANQFRGTFELTVELEAVEAAVFLVSAP